MVARYNYHFSVGRNYHKLEVYISYSSVNGLTDLVSSFTDTNFSKISKSLKSYFTKEQIVKIKSAAKLKEDGIIDENCEFHNN